MEKIETGKVLRVLVALVIAISSLFVFQYDFRTTFYSIFPDGAIKIPSVSDGTEVENLGYKFSNSSGVIVSTEPEIHCQWKPDEIDDGWKECEAIFEVENFRRDRPKLKNPDIEFDFLDEGKIRNVEVSYSQSYTVVEETFVEQLAMKEETGEDKTVSLMGMVIAKDDENNDDNQIKKIRFFKRQFKEFKPIPSSVNLETIGNEALEDQSQVSDEIEKVDTDEDMDNPEDNLTEVFEEVIGDSNDSNEQIFGDPETWQNETNETEQESNFTEELDTNETEQSEEDNVTGGNETQQLGFMTGFSIEGEDLSINTAKPFAIRVTFEVPKYSTNQFNFGISEGGFYAVIDPEVSACGTLDIEGTYTLSQDVSSEETCFTIGGENIILDCQEHSIEYSTAGNGSGIYVTADNVLINNCNILSATGEYGVFIDLVDNVTVQFNAINVSGNYAFGIYTESATNLNLLNNTINHSGNSGGGISINSDIGDLVFGNIIYTSEDNVNGILYSGGDGFNISGNSFYTYGANSHGIYAFEVTNSFVEDNFVSLYGNESCAIYLEYNSIGNEVKTNNLSAGGINGCGIYLESDSPNNLLMDNFILAFGQDAFAIDIASNTNNLTGNNIITTNNRGAGIFLENEGLDNVIYGGSILTSGEENHGVYVGNNVGTLTITGTNLKTLNLNSYALYVLGGDMNLSVSHSVLNSSFYNTPDFKIGDLIIGGVWNFTNVSFLDKNWPEDVEAVLYVTDYLDILASYANGSEAANVNVTAFDSNGSFQFSELSNEDGEIPSKLLFEYVQSGYDQVFSYSNYTLTASLYDRSENLSKSINLSEIEIVRFIFGEEPESVLESPPDLEEEAEPEQVGGGSCKSGWECSKWSECVNGKKTRTCVNKNPLCNAGKPPEEKECEEKRKALFDINLRLLNGKVTPGQRLLGAITLINVGLPGKVDANLHYSIENDLGNNLGEWHENVKVETQTEFIKSFNTRGLEEGGYTLFVNLDYEGQLEPASTESRFVVANTGQTPDNIWKLSVWLIFVLFVLAISFLVFLKRRNLKRVADEKGVLEESVTEEPVAMKP